MDAFDPKFVEKRRKIRVGKLDFLTVDGSGPAMRGVLRTQRRRMAQGEKRFGNILRHGDVNVPGSMVPIDLEAKITRAGPIFGELVSGGESGEEMIGVGFGKELDTEVVDSESESGAAFGVAPETGRMSDGNVTIRGEMSLELVIGENGSLFETVHAFADFNENVALGVEVIFGEIVFGNDFRREVAAMDLHILVDDHIRDEEEVFQVASAVTGTEMSVGDDTVKMELGVGKTSGRGGTDVLISVEAVATHNHADAIRFRLAGAHGADKGGVCILATSRDLMWFDENHSVVTANLITEGTGLREALSAAAPFIGEGLSSPDGRVRAAKERVDVLDLAGDGIVHLASNGGIVLDRLGKGITNMGARIEAKASETGAGTLAEKVDERRRLRNGDRHSWKWSRDSEGPPFPPLSLFRGSAPSEGVQQGRGQAPSEE